MKRFQFPLERVRLWRQQQAALELAKLEHLAGQLAALKEEKKRIQGERDQSEQKLLQEASVAAVELQALAAYREHVRRRTGQIEQGQRELGFRIEQQRTSVMEAKRRAELLERLKTRRLDEWQMAAQRAEETLATELFLAKRVRAR
jgi:hypothetical protein